MRTVRWECLDHLLVVNVRHLEQILRSYACHYNCYRPHQGLSQEIPEPERAGRPLAIEDASNPSMGRSEPIGLGYVETTVWAG